MRALLILFLSCASLLCAQDARQIDVLYLRILQPKFATLSNLDAIPDDLGVQGAILAVNDNNTTGRFVGYAFDLEVVTLGEGDIDGARNALANSTAEYVVFDMSAEQQLAAKPADDRIYFNVRAYDDALRGENCANGLYHTIPSYAMRADALMQFALLRQWDSLVLLEGNAVDDTKFARALRNAAAKYGLSFDHDAKWPVDGDLRRQAATEVPLFTQQFGKYDAMIISDESNDFARYVLYNTWLPRPILGGDGLTSRAWSPAVEQWGAAQLQRRFIEQSGRTMRDIDYAAWVALRSIDEALVRTDFGTTDDVESYFVDGLQLAGFKGRPLSYRSWDGQLRQPIALAHSSAMVAMAPLDGFLHAVNELDSLGVDEPETQCKYFGASK